MSFNRIALAAILSFSAGIASPGDTHAETFAEQFPKIGEIDEGDRAFLETLTYRHGLFELKAADAELDVPDSFYFLDGADARHVLEDAWANPPGANVLGMLFPSRMTPLDNDSWGVVVTYDPMGYVSDEDAESIDYDDLLEAMTDETAAANPEREKAGYEPITLIGWAAAPHYDQPTRKLHWAQELKFGQSEINTLNYNIRALGRQGVLVMNFVAAMDDLAEIEASIEPVLAMSHFVEGKRYEDFDPSVDTVAAVGIGGLIAGKVLAKTGFLVLALALLKKFGALLLLPILAVWRGVAGSRDK